MGAESIFIAVSPQAGAQAFLGMDWTAATQAEVGANLLAMSNALPGGEESLKDLANMDPEQVAKFIASIPPEVWIQNCFGKGAVALGNTKRFADIAPHFQKPSPHLSSTIINWDLQRKAPKAEVRVPVMLASPDDTRTQRTPPIEEPRTEKTGGTVITLNVGNAGNTAAAPRYLVDKEGTKKYEYLRFLASGGKATLDVVRDAEGQEWVAKEINDPLKDKEAIERLLREGEAYKKVSHPNLVRLHDTFTRIDERGHDKLVLILEKVEGQTLTEIISNAPAFGEENILEVGRQIASVIQSLKEAGYVHRDLNPSNIMVSEKEGKPFVKVLDLGLVKDVGQRTQDGSLGVGTIWWMAPEQLHGQKVTEATDAHALGLVLIALARRQLRTNLVEIAHPEDDLQILKMEGKWSPAFLEVLSGLVNADPQMRLQALARLRSPLVASTAIVPSAAQIASGMAVYLDATDIARQLETDWEKNNANKVWPMLGNFGLTALGVALCLRFTSNAWRFITPDHIVLVAAELFGAAAIFFGNRAQAFAAYATDWFYTRTWTLPPVVYIDGHIEKPTFSFSLRYSNHPRKFIREAAVTPVDNISDLRANLKGRVFLNGVMVEEITPVETKERVRFKVHDGVPLSVPYNEFTFTVSGDVNGVTLWAVFTVDTFEKAESKRNKLLATGKTIYVVGDVETPSTLKLIGFGPAFTRK